MKNSHLKIGLTVLGVMIVAVVAVPRIKHRAEIREAEELLSRKDAAIEVNLSVPFTTQAPHANWDMPYQEACEEASALMAIRYVFNTGIDDAEDADAALLDLLRANEVILGYPVDQTAAQVRDLFLEIDDRMIVHLLKEPSVEKLQQELASGNVIVVPAAGRKLKNPFFNQPGPLYHMLVLRGYTRDGYFITNDPGTKRGEGYLYPYEVIMDAMGDWNNGSPQTGQKIVVVVEPRLLPKDEGE